ncbi:hypothetical protein GCM10007907_35230 [Chitinimonas prasina]|uniref:AAA family ATPase n=1 Tax=Chitinimonas prasina TaxID=1434937 RepID=A0ABQ5YL90_9NEIS|nr:AAA family ATPase [Chitinimonas prasina]GLR14733.1 hypothetical protein GCM10007907_35230 [Chitinimonas prasina]
MDLLTLIQADNLIALKQPVSLRGPAYAELQQLVAQAGAEPDWQAVLAALPCLLPLARTPQDPRYHGEGDVWTHTRMVVQALCAGEDYAQADAERRFVLFYAALLHDMAKPATTTVDAVNGHIGQPGHSGRGAVDARILLWRSGVPFALREAICRLIAVHQLPFYALRGSRSGQTAEFIVRKLSHELCIAELAALAEADMRGRYCADADEVLLYIELFRELAREEGCYTQARAFADSHTRMRYFNGDDVHPDYAYHREPGSRVTVMCGLPATGKSTWLAQHCKDLPLVGFDDAREELGLKYGENDGRAVHHAVDKAKALLRARSDFVWNATHLSRQMRAKTLDLLFAYGATVEVIYLEQAERTLLERNRRRDSSLSNTGLLRMLHRWEVVLPSEAHSVRYLTAV